MDVRGDNRGVPREMMEHHVNYYPHDEMHQMRPPPANRAFQPSAYVPPAYVPPQQGADNVQEVDLPNRDQNQEGEEEEEEDDEEHMSRFDANEETVWIDSDGDEETENIILKRNFFLPYSDHNYDMPTPEERVIHPIEGPFAIIGGLDEEGNVIRQYMPPGYEAYGEEFGVPDELELADRAAAEEARLAQIQYQQQYQLHPQVYAVPPVARNHMMYQPELGIAAAAAGGARPAQVQHQQQPHAVQQRGVVPMREEPYRPQHEYVAPQLVAQPRVSGPKNRAAPTTAILRETQQGQEHVVTRREQQQNHQPSRNPAPPPPQQHQQQRQQARVGNHVPQLNDYSAAAAQLLATLNSTAGAEELIEDARCHRKARRMFVEENVAALVTSEVVSRRQVILEMNGHVSMSNEVKRQPGGGNSVFMYDGLMKNTSGEDIGDHKELVCVDTKKKGNDSRFVRRSCVPNCVLLHVLGSQATLGIMIVANKDIHRNVEVTLPFDADWRDSDVPLECAEHLKELQMCPFEAERRRYTNERHRNQETERRKAEEARRADEERRRLEDEVRLEVAAGTRQMDEEVKLERMAPLPKKAERACKKEAEKKLEAEGKASEKKPSRNPAPPPPQRRRYANERHRSQETERRAAEEYRRANEEIRRLEDEIRQMDEEAEQERMASNCVKKTENDKADKKKLKRMAPLPKKAERACKKKAMEKLEAERKASEKKRKATNARIEEKVEAKKTRR
ncbi:hypothetical protein CAEBREN_03809 [Caenorhabditis brenneri]|uniref:SET domain-containing protein n=1 Tax=Caenorhabditis brenneri TaxID=135651 RepID=G0MQK1_CAEBE|nr:hypothetical protein CAEBREN_03809 [Caenorhabditis brenneri]